MCNYDESSYGWARLIIRLALLEIKFPKQGIIGKERERKEI